MPSDLDAVRLEEHLLRFVRTELLAERPVEIDGDTHLFADGLIDSLKIVQLIAFLELQTGREIPDTEVVMKHFRTVRTMASRFGGGR